MPTAARTDGAQRGLWVGASCWKYARAPFSRGNAGKMDATNRLKVGVERSMEVFLFSFGYKSLSVYVVSIRRMFPQGNMNTRSLERLNLRLF